MEYDILIVGSGLFGSVCAYELSKKGHKVLVVEKREHIGGNIYTEQQNGITIHKYGAHIFHTNNKEIWDYINNFGRFNNFINSPIAVYKNEIYNLPFNMNTFTKMWSDVFTPRSAEIHIEKERSQIKEKPKNLEEQAISLVGKTIYEKLIKGYTEKQWGKDCKDLPPEIIKRLPVRFTYNNNYFNDKYQGVPVNGYTSIIEEMLKGIEVRFNYDYLKNKGKIQAKTIIYTGPIDEYYNYCFGKLEYRSLRFENKTLNMENFQGNAVVNYTDIEVPYTRIIEHKHFNNDVSDKTIITHEYPEKWCEGKEPYYPINNENNNKLYLKYKELADKENNIYFGGRLGLYKYLDMDKTIEEAFDLLKRLKEN